MSNETAPTDPGWWIYKCLGKQQSVKWPAVPPWRSFADPDRIPAKNLAPPPESLGDGQSRSNPDRGKTYLASPDQKQLVNLALYLRRPLLITGKPGTGKSSLAYSIAWELGLGPVLRWPITSRSTLAEGLYRYDAIGRLQEVQLNKEKAVNISNYLSLGPLGTALLPARQPRVLLIDEIDKSDIDLPNDLLNIFEEGEYEIPELARYPEDDVPVRLFESRTTVTITKGRVRCCAFPIVIMTSNGEREFPQPLLRRCLRLNIPAPQDREVLTSIVNAHLTPELRSRAERPIEAFLEHRKNGHLASDQLLNAVFVLSSAIGLDQKSEDEIIQALYQTLGRADVS